MNTTNSFRSRWAPLQAHLFIEYGKSRRYAESTTWRQEFLPIRDRGWKCPLYFFAGAADEGRVAFSDCFFSSVASCVLANFSLSSKNSSAAASFDYGAAIKGLDFWRATFCVTVRQSFSLVQLRAIDFQWMFRQMMLHVRGAVQIRTKMSFRNHCGLPQAEKKFQEFNIQYVNWKHIFLFICDFSSSLVSLKQKLTT